MSRNFKVHVNIPTDNNGMIGRKCPKCHMDFKLGLGTGLTTPHCHCHCPCCGYEGDTSGFRTKTQLEYAKSRGDFGQ